MIGAGQGWRKRMIGGRPHYGRQPANDVAGALVRLAADRLGGGERALLQASLVEYFEQGLPEPKKHARRSAG